MGEISSHLAAWQKKKKAKLANRRIVRTHNENGVTDKSVNKAEEIKCGTNKNL
jgi:hypothetical protein